MRSLTALFFVTGLAAATAPAWSERVAPNVASGEAAGFPGWSAGPVSPEWARQSLGPREARFARDFPGQIALFSADGRTFVVRWISRPTRRLHPAADCLRALGYRIEPRPLRQKLDGTTWSTLDADRGTEHLRVHERILGADGRAWTDVSTWFWQASFGSATGPWWVVTEIGPKPDADRH